MGLEADLADAIALHDAGRWDDAERRFARIAAIYPGVADIYVQWALTPFARGSYREGIKLLDTAIAIEPTLASAHYNRAMALARLSQFAEAEPSARAAVALSPSTAEAHALLGTVSLGMLRLPEAIVSLTRATQLKPDAAAAWCSLATALFQAKRLEEALGAARRALSLSSNGVRELGILALIQEAACDWDGLPEIQARIADAMRRGEPPPSALAYLTYEMPSEDRLRAARSLAAKYSGIESGERLAPYRHERIRVAYVSGDFYDHATSHLLAGLVERQDRSRFELHGVSIQPSPRDDMRERLIEAFDHFHDADHLTDNQVAALLRRLEIDIALDLKGFTTGARPAIFAARAAPIQISYLGFPGTMGAEFIDYLIADRTVIPPDARKHYAEKIIYMPDSYQVNDSKRVVSFGQFSRADLNLPDRGLIFCCFNQNYKIAPHCFDIWMRLLRQAPGSVLWLLESDAVSADNLRRAALARGVAPERLVFAPRMPLSSHLARHEHADLVLDTWPVNAHTTASDALWAGVPVLTYATQCFTGRVAASLLMATGLSELIAESPEDYAAKASALAANPARLAEFKARLARTRGTAPLFDTQRYTHHFETALEEVYQRNLSGRPPEHIENKDKTYHEHP